MSELMLGNQAVARGLYEAGVSVISSYPGTPSTEITEFSSKYPEDEMYCDGRQREGSLRGRNRRKHCRCKELLRYEARWS